MSSELLNLDVLEDVSNILLQKTQKAEKLYSACGQITEISGKDKLRRKIKAELNFLKKLASKSPDLNINQLKSSNLPHLSAIVESISRLEGVLKLLMPATYIEENISKRIIIDVVADYGKTWVKVVARNPDALLQLSRGAGKFGRKSLIEQIKELKDCAIQNEYQFVPPRILVCFVGNIDEELLTALMEMDVEVLYLSSDQCLCETSDVSGPKNQSHMPSDSKRLEKEMPGSSEEHASHFLMVPGDSQRIIPVLKARDLDPNSNLALAAIMEDATLNLDVSCMIAYISNLTNGFHDVKLKDKILREQGEREAIAPVRCYLDALFPGRKLVCCDSAYTRFIDIFKVIGGEQEKRRAADLLSHLEIVPDDPSVRCMRLQEHGKINKKSKVIFGTGDTLKAITVTANAGFVRAATCQGENFVAFLHESRALSEMNELPDL